MSTHKNMNIVCVVAIIFALIITAVVMNVEHFGIKSSTEEIGYESRIFDSTKVHTIDITMDNWDEFIESCENEEYSACSVDIDGENYSNVAIRAKGNTSLSSVSAMDSERYSFKIEFDQYNSGETYHGLDKLSLNNLIQDNTYMKDYLTYKMMDSFGVNSPLCSFVYITVNGEDWGLYLAVEGVEDSFLNRNYGNDYGELYKPDSMDMGGGRGNGKEFNMEDFNKDNSSNEDNGETVTEITTATETQTETKTDDVSGATVKPDKQNNEMPQNDMPEGEFPAGKPPEGEMVQNSPPNQEMKPDNPVQEAATSTDKGAQGTGMPEKPQMPEGGPEGFGGVGSGATLKYVDDETDSYSTIFDSAKTDIINSDKSRLIASLKTLSEGENLETVLDIDQLMRYFVVHNYVVNGDSYTGSMIHNYYLYEKDGRMSMIPWDYNLAYGCFQGNDANSAVNDAIDSPLNVEGDGSKPMADWIFSNEEYTQVYHEYIKNFIETVDAAEIIDSAYEIIAPYVKKDPTSFCTYEEFEKGVATLKSFCELRTSSVSGQLEGSIPSTDEGQSADNSTLIDASSVNISDMGTMGMGGGGMPDFGGKGFREMKEGNSSTDSNIVNNENGGPPQFNNEGEIPEQGKPSNETSVSDTNVVKKNAPEGFSDNKMLPGEENGNTISKNDIIFMGASLMLLIIAIIIALKFRRR